MKAMEERALSRLEAGGSEELEKAKEQLNSSEGSESGSAPGEGDDLSNGELSEPEENLDALEQRQRADKS